MYNSKRIIFKILWNVVLACSFESTVSCFNRSAFEVARCAPSWLWGRSPGKRRRSWWIPSSTRVSMTTPPSDGSRTVKRTPSLLTEIMLTGIAITQTFSVRCVKIWVGRLLMLLARKTTSWPLRRVSTAAAAKTGQSWTHHFPEGMFRDMICLRDSD